MIARLGDLDDAVATAPKYSVRECAALLGLGTTVVGEIDESARFKFCAHLLLNLIEDPIHGDDFSQRLALEVAADEEMQLLLAFARCADENGWKFAHVFDDLDERADERVGYGDDVTDDELDEALDALGQLLLFPDLFAGAA
jgi:hypothetical protein